MAALSCLNSESYLSLTLSGAEQVFSSQTKITFLFEYPLYEINRTMFFTYEWLWFEILESYAKTRLWRVTDIHLAGVICIHFAK